MSYEALLEEVKTVPKEKLEELAMFINFLKYSSGITSSYENSSKNEIAKSKEPFFNAVGKISFDKDAVEKFRNVSMI